jgi:hypothetical protein
VVKEPQIGQKNSLGVWANLFRERRENSATDETRIKHGFVQLFVKSVFYPWLLVFLEQGLKAGIDFGNLNVGSVRTSAAA